MLILVCYYARCVSEIDTITIEGLECMCYTATTQYGVLSCIKYAFPVIVYSTSNEYENSYISQVQCCILFSVHSNIFYEYVKMDQRLHRANLLGTLRCSIDIVLVMSAGKYEIYNYNGIVIRFQSIPHSDG